MFQISELYMKASSNFYNSVLTINQKAQYVIWKWEILTENKIFFLLFANRTFVQ